MSRPHSLLRHAAVGLAPLAALALVAGCGSNGSTKGSTGSGSTSSLGTIKVGVIGALTGSSSSYGTDWLHGVQLAVANAAECKGLDVQLDSVDSKGDPQAGVTAVNKLIADNVTAVMGDVLSSVTIPITVLTARHDLPVFTGSSGVEVTDRKLPGIFRIIFRDDQAGPFDADTAYNKLNARKAVVITDTSAYGEGLADQFSKQFKKDGGTVLSTQTITPGQSDYSSTVAKAHSQDPDLVYYSGFYPEAALLVKQGKAQGLNNWQIGGGGFDNKFMSLGGAATDGVIVSGWPTAVNDPTMATYLSEYKAKYGDPGVVGQFGYDGMAAYCKAVKAVDSTNPAKVVKELHSASFSLNGLSGPIKFDAKGDRQFPPLAELKVQNGQFTTYVKQANS
jgi:branched-chain amino acid transport system substrate-binding protein